MRPTARPVACVSALIVALAVPPSAQAHGFSGRADLPIPGWLFGWAAALVLIVSFVALAVLWPTPRLERPDLRQFPDVLSRVLGSSATQVLCGAIGIGLLALVVYSGLAGSSDAGENLAPTFIYVGFWLGLVPLSLLFGDVFRPFNPWRAVGRLAGWLMRSRAPEPLPYPEWLGRWPAAAGLLGFAWMELAAYGGNDPRNLAIATLVYSTLTWFAMGIYGVQAWTERGEAFSVYFNLLSRLSVFAWRDGRLGVRPPLSGLPDLRAAPGTVALLAVMIGTVSFDGARTGPAFQSIVPTLQDFWGGLGGGKERALELTFTTGLIAGVLFVFALYWLGVAGARTVGGDRGPRELADAFVHSLVPIALAYVAAHYVSFLIFQGQALAPLASDPLGDGWNLFGTAAWTIDYAFIGAETFWYLQVGFVVAGHVAALVLAHDRALALYEDPRLGVRSQYWMLGVMVAFTTLALWLLNQSSQG